MTDAPAKDRLDKWLWHARFFKTRSLAASIVADGKVRVNGERVTKRATSVGAGDVLTFAQGRHVRVIRIEQIAARRGPASEAQGLYSDVSPPSEGESGTERLENPAFEGKGRPTKKARRQVDLSKRSYLE